MTNNKRAEDRDTCSIAATLIISDYAAPISCIVTDISERGARISIDISLELPDNFVLVLPIDGEINHKGLVQLRWRIGKSAGLKFVRDKAG